VDIFNDGRLGLRMAAQVKVR